MSTFRLIHSVTFKPCSNLATADASRPSFLEYANIHKGQSWKIKKEQRWLESWDTMYITGYFPNTIKQVSSTITCSQNSVFCYNDHNTCNFALLHIHIRRGTMLTEIHPIQYFYHKCCWMCTVVLMKHNYKYPSKLTLCTLNLIEQTF